MFRENEYRTQYCNAVSESDIGRKVRAAGWVENIRDHGGIMFVDLRDHYGQVQIVFHNEALLEGISKECAVSITGTVLKRDESTYNDKIETGTVEIEAEEVRILGKVTAEQLPFEVDESRKTKEDLRLKYRYLDLRNRKMHDNIIFRSKVISFLRSKMTDMGFLELQTPILSTSSPEGARDYLIPSRKHHGKFYALPQAPQIFKQIYMVSGFDKYFQIAPCFRDEDARADRSPGEFYQLDFEMSFATQEDVFAVAEEILSETFAKFSDKQVSSAPFRRIPFEEAMLTYGTDKPDLRNPLVIKELSDLFVDSDFKPFSNKTVRGIRVPKMASQSKSFFKNMEDFATKEVGMKGLGYFKVEEGEDGKKFKYNGPIDKFLDDGQRDELAKRCELEIGDVLYFIADSAKNAPKFAGQIRTEVAKRMELIDESRFELCFIVDFPMYELDEETGKIIFTHNPFSMPQGGLDALMNKDPLDILAYQYDIVCNGVELSSGAVRNHDLDIMVKAFEIAGYTEEDVASKFGALYNAFKYGAPPHAGMAPGVDRMIMLLTGEESIREIIAFPLNSNAQDLLLGAPTEVTEQQLREVHIKVRKQM
ncbi:MAG: aspartate--tRNA ligase [Oscillospiraceae bacterium]|nr:aspartate--tRNA ligase [Oscillospiraceae bacterium]